MPGQEEKKLLSAYLFVGSDILKRESLLKRLMKRIGQSCDLVLNAQTFDASQVKEASDVIDACLTVPFLSPLRLVVIKNAEKTSKQLVDALVTYLEAPCETTVMVLEAEKLAKNSRLLTAVKKISPVAVIDCSEKKRSELPSLVQTMAQSRGVEISYDAANRLVELVGTSMLTLDREVEKSALYVLALGRRRINRNDINSLVVRSVEASPWELVEAFAQRNHARSFELLQELKNESPVNLLALCVMRIRDLITVKSLQERGITDLTRIAAELARPDWQARRLIQASQAFTRAELRDLISKAAEIDKKMKSGYDASLLLSIFLLEA